MSNDAQKWEIWVQVFEEIEPTEDLVDPDLEKNYLLKKLTEIFNVAKEISREDVDRAISSWEGSKNIDGLKNILSNYFRNVEKLHGLPLPSTFPHTGMPLAKLARRFARSPVIFQIPALVFEPYSLSPDFKDLIKKGIIQKIRLTIWHEEYAWLAQLEAKVEKIADFEKTIISPAKEESFTRLKKVIMALNELMDVLTKGQKIFFKGDERIQEKLPKKRLFQQDFNNKIETLLKYCKESNIPPICDLFWNSRFTSILAIKKECIPDQEDGEGLIRMTRYALGNPLLHVSTIWVALSPTAGHLLLSFPTPTGITSLLLLPDHINEVQTAVSVAYLSGTQNLFALRTLTDNLRLWRIFLYFWNLVERAKTLSTKIVIARKEVIKITKQIERSPYRARKNFTQLWSKLLKIEDYLKDIHLILGRIPEPERIWGVIKETYNGTLYARGSEKSLEKVFQGTREQFYVILEKIEKELKYVKEFHERSVNLVSALIEEKTQKAMFALGLLVVITIFSTVSPQIPFLSEIMTEVLYACFLVTIIITIYTFHQIGLLSRIYNLLKNCN